MKIYNTMTRSKEDFIPITPGEVRMYACGPTVYNYFHIGNARAFLTFDMIRRYLEYRGFKVTYVQNITDIDDKIIATAQQQHVSFEEIAGKFTRAFLEDVQRLGTLPPTYQPKATDYIDRMIDVISRLVDSGYAYPKQGDVYFAVTRLPEYGRLSGKNIEDLRAGARVEENYQKQHPADFTLWKAAKPGEPSWDSPWGKGRPGWHTECVAMSENLLGKTFDIHGGGNDLMFPHHENELAQALALNHQPLAHYWLHNGFLNIEGEKMSKSLGNFFTTREVLEHYDAEVIRFFFLSKHYRSPIDYSNALLTESETALRNFYDALKSVDWLHADRGQISLNEEAVQLESQFITAMDDDFNTAKALAVLFDLASKVRSNNMEMSQRLAYASLLVKLGAVLGFFTNLEAKLAPTLDADKKAQIEALIAQRNTARANRDWAESDRLRDELIALGVQIKDTKDGTVWQIM